MKTLFFFFFFLISFVICDSYSLSGSEDGDIYAWNVADGIQVTILTDCFAYLYFYPQIIIPHPESETHSVPQ